MTAYNRRTRAELCMLDDIAVARAQIRRLTARVENEVIPDMARRHAAAILDGRIISLRYTDAELIEQLRATTALRIDSAD